MPESDVCTPPLSSTARRRPTGYLTLTRQQLGKMLDGERPGRYLTSTNQQLEKCVLYNEADNIRRASPDCIT